MSKANGDGGQADGELVVVKAYDSKASDVLSTSEGIAVSSTTVTRPPEEGDGNCECGHDLFNRVLGPTADEAILSGLNSIKCFVERILYCGGDSSAKDETPPKCECEADGSECLNADCQTETCNKVDCGVTPKPMPSEIKCICCQCCQTDAIPCHPCSPSVCNDHKAVCCNMRPKLCNKCCKTSRCCFEKCSEKRKDNVCACRRSGKRKSSLRGSTSCDSGCKGDHKADKTCLCQVRYAITKISIAKDFTTYEVMRSTHCTPKKMPKCVENVFVLKKKTC